MAAAASRSPARVVVRPTGPVEPLGPEVRALAWTAVGGLALAAAYRWSGGTIGVPCPLRMATGLSCPLCGSTRVAASVFDGDLHAAWAYNAPMLLIGSVAAVLVGYQVLAWAAERTRLLRVPRLRVRPRAQAVLANSFLVVMVVFGVLRNV